MHPNYPSEHEFIILHTTNLRVNSFIEEIIFLAYPIVPSKISYRPKKEIRIL